MRFGGKVKGFFKSVGQKIKKAAVAVAKGIKKAVHEVGNFIKKDVIVEVRPRANPVNAGTGTLQLSDIRLRIITKEHPLHDMFIKELHNKHNLLFPYVEPVVFEETKTLTASTQSDITV